MIIPVILSGGNGTRLWPLSSSERPKQFIKLINNNTLFKETILRFSNSDTYSSPIVLSNIRYYDLVMEELRNNKIDSFTVFLEPMVRNTAPAIASVVLYLNKKTPDDIVLFIPSDAYIDDVERFNEFIIEGKSLAEDNKLVCFGIKPSHPETGYGYIKCGKKIGLNSYMVDNFTEKPNLETAIEFLKNKNYLWNAGIFMCKVSVIFELFAKYTPDLSKTVEDTLAKSKIEDGAIYLNNDSFSKCKNISVDYALIEKLNREQLAAVSMNIIWNDIGSYKSLYDVNPNKTKDGNIICGNVILNNTNNCYISSQNKIICCSDVDDLVIVEKGDYILVMKKSRSQNVRTIVESVSR